LAQAPNGVKQEEAKGRSQPVRQMMEEEEYDDDDIVVIDESFDENNFKEGFYMWLTEFYKKYLDFDSEQASEYRVSVIQKELFIVQNDGLFLKLAPDIGGHMVKRILESEK